LNILVNPGGNFSGVIKIDGDKSISHRAVMFGAIAEGVTHVTDILLGEDVLATITAFEQMGVTIQQRTTDLTIHGVGLRGLKKPSNQLDMGNSGTAFRLLAGILCGQSWRSSMGGDASLSGRPMGRIIKPLSMMGARIDSDNEMPPITISPNPGLRGITYEMPIASAQVKSAVLLAGLYAQGETRVREPAPTRDHTERMLGGFGYEVEKKGDWISLSGGGRLTGCEIEVPADLSSATFFIVATAVSQNSEVVLPRVGVNPSRNGVLPILARMGANIVLENTAVVGGEPVADIRVRSSRLVGVDLDAEDIALAVDEIPAIAVAAACAEGVTEIRGAEELRVKESDRIATTVAGLRALGIDVEEHPDGMTIQGGELSAGRVDSHGDHRIAMAFAMAGNVASGEVQIINTDCVATSFPGFQSLAKSAGLQIVSC
jgi:3-phosphoshikimate 1-carboxyvinyltransferase